MKKLLALLCCLALGLAPSIVLGDDCVEVDIELTPTAAHGEMAEFSIELTNCGTEAALVELSVWLNTGTPIPVPPLSFYLPVGAGETATRSWLLPIPPVIPAGTYQICLKATIGEVSDSDCAAIEITAPSGVSSRSGSAVSAASTDDCVEVDIELNEAGTIGEGLITQVEFSAELTNCGLELALAAITVELSGTFGTFPPFTFFYPVGAGETVAHSWLLAFPGALSGTYDACLTATIGEASDTDCASITLENTVGPTSRGGKTLSQNYPNPFNLSTGIAFSLSEPTEVRLTVHNILGQEVALLAEGTFEPGEHVVTWDARDRNGSVVATGVYLYRLTSGDVTMSKKMILVK